MMIIQKRAGFDGALILTPKAESLDMANAASFREQYASLIEGSTGPVTVDCSYLEFIDSSGVGAFLHANKLLPDDRRPIHLTGVGGKVLTLLELMHVHRSFHILPRE